MKLRNQHDPRYRIKKNRPVYVYKNLHKDCWSIKQHGLVKAHIPKDHAIGLWDCYFHVDVKGREKVLREKRKNVHAFVRGYISNNCSPAVLDEIYYNPYKAKTFVDFQGNPVHQAEFVELDLKHGEPPVLALNPT